MIETERLIINVASDEEIRALIASQTDEGLKAAYGEMLAGCEAHPEQREWYAPWNITLKTGDVVGDLGFKGLSADGAVEIGYGFLPEFWGKGYATEAVKAAVRWAAAQPEVKRIEAETVPDNAASQRVLEKAGFVPSGITGEEGPRFIFENLVK